MDFSWLIVARLAAKLAFVHGWIDRTRFESYFPSTKLLETIFAASHWPWWQITLGTDALLTFLLLYFADAALARLDTPHAWREPFVLGTWRGSSISESRMGDYSQYSQNLGSCCGNRAPSRH